MYYILKIPYISKGSLKSEVNSNSYSFEGNAYIYVSKDTGKMFHSFALLNDNFKYRPTDQRMINAAYWKNNNFRTTRELFFESSNENLKLVTFAGKIEKLNEHIMKNFNTLLTTQGLIYGSNPTGAEQTKNSSVLLINEDRYEKKYKYHRFVNFFNTLKDTSYKYSKDKLLKMYNETEDFLSIDDFFTLFPHTKNEFLIKYNFEFTDEFTEKNLDNDVTSFEDYKVQTIIQLYEEKHYSLEKFKEKLRTIYAANVNVLIKEKFYNKTYTVGNNHPTPEKAHILSFSSLIKNNRFYEAVDPKNCMLLSPDLHKLFDKNFITFDQNGTCIAIKNGVEINNDYNIDSKILKSMGIKKYLKENYDYYQNKGVNY